jgi:hypothetical protein
VNFIIIEISIINVLQINIIKKTLKLTLLWRCRFHSILGQSRASGGVVDHPEYVIFDKAQALPIAVVTYQHTSSCRCCRCSN